VKLANIPLVDFLKIPKGESAECAEECASNSYSNLASGNGHLPEGRHFMINRCKPLNK